MECVHYYSLEWVGWYRSSLLVLWGDLSSYRCAQGSLLRGENGKEKVLRVFSKIDLVSEGRLEELRELYPDGVFVSSETLEGVDGLKERVVATLVDKGE